MIIQGARSRSEWLQNEMEQIFLKVGANTLTHDNLSKLTEAIRTAPVSFHRTQSTCIWWIQSLKRVCIISPVSDSRLATASERVTFDMDYQPTEHKQVHNCLFSLKGRVTDYLLVGCWVRRRNERALDDKGSKHTSSCGRGTEFSKPIKLSSNSKWQVSGMIDFTSQV